MLLITQPRNGSEIRALAMAARELDWETYDAPTGWRLPDEIIELSKNHEIIVPYGSQIFCECIAQQLNLKLKLNSFDWLTKIPYKYLGRKVEFMTLQQAKQIKETKFIKPADDKCFDAKIYNVGEFNPNEFIDQNYPVLVSDSVQFVSEYRCFVKNQKVLTCSCYLLNGEINNPKNWDLSSIYVSDWLNARLQSNQIISESAVIDCGFLDTEELVIIESNPVWASGIYGCDLESVLEVLKDSVIKL